MRKLIKVIAVPVLCCIILCILFFMVDFRSNGEEDVELIALVTMAEAEGECD